MFTLIISMMSATMFNIVLPEIKNDFRINTAQVSWITSIYILVFSIGTIMYGKLADTIKLKNLLTVGVLLCAVGSLIGLSAQAYSVVLLGRFIQAVGAAVIPATAMIIPVRYFNQEERGRAFGMASAGIALGNAVGPVVSALLVSVVHWQWLFCLPLFFLLTVPFYRKYLDDTEKKRSKFDWIGGLLLGSGVALIMLSVTEGIWLLSIGGLFVLSLFIWRIHLAVTPFLRPELLKNKHYRIGLLIAFLSTGTGFSLYFLSPLLFANVNDLAPGLIGFSMVPAAVIAATLGLKGGKLADTKGNSYLFYFASLLLVICFFLLSSVVGISVFVIATILIIGNVGQTFIIIALSNVVSSTLYQRDAGVGMGLMATLNFISGGIAATVFSKMVDLGSTVTWNPLHIYENGYVFSNIYLVLFVINILIVALYYYHFHKKSFRTKVDTL